MFPGLQRHGPRPLFTVESLMNPHELGRAGAAPARTFNLFSQLLVGGEGIEPPTSSV
jgi:hypothetical protein